MTMQLTIGDYDVITIRDHIGAEREPSAVYTDVPVEAWERYKAIALDPDGLWRSVWRAHLIRPTSGAGPVILVDAGMGPGPHAHTGRGGELLDNLAAEGVSPEQVDSVVTTHVHGDHIGWNITWDNDTPRLTFPNATYHIASNDWIHYTTAGNSNEAFDRSVLPLEGLGNLKLVEGEYELAAGVRTIPTNGHTPGHQCVRIESGGMTAVLTGDLFHNIAQITEQTWCPSFDWNTEMSTASRKALLSKAQTEGWTVFSGHFPDGKSIGHVVDSNGESAWRSI